MTPHRQGRFGKGHTASFSCWLLSFWSPRARSFPPCSPSHR